jgi:hypothetical protein
MRDFDQIPVGLNTAELKEYQLGTAMTSCRNDTCN